MIKNNKPYSNENGAIDRELLNAKNPEEQEIILQWIKTNLRKSDSFYSDSTSYGLKHLLEHDVSIYLTNNQFKDAMMISGFKHQDPNQLNWCFNIDKHSPIYIKGKRITFKVFIKIFYKDDKSNYGRLVELFSTNRELRSMTKSSYKSYKNYLECIKASADMIKAFEELWCKYQDWLTKNGQLNSRRI